MQRSREAHSAIDTANRGGAESDAVRGGSREDSQRKKEEKRRETGEGGRNEEGSDSFLDPLAPTLCLIGSTSP